MHRLLVFFLIMTSAPSFAQVGVSDEILEHLDDELNIGGDIFSNFQEDIESSQMLEDERFYRFGRFFSVNFGIGVTSFLGNRGNAYDDKLPAMHLSFNYFFNLRSSFILGVEYSGHIMDIDYPSNIDGSNDGIGRIDVTFIRPFLGYRYYFDTTNLGNIFTYSNPYFTARFEYWYQKNDFDDPQIDDETGGGIGAGIGFGVELPLKLKQRYLGVEMLFQPANLTDSDTKFYQNTDGVSGFRNLNGPGFSLFVSLNETW